MYSCYAAADRRKGLRTLVHPWKRREEPQHAEEGILAEKDRREEGGGSLRGIIHDPCATPRKGSLVSLFWSRALRDFWISASLVTREPKTVGQVASRRNESERANGEREGISYPSRARTLWSSVQPLNGERSLRLQRKKNCARWHLVLSPLFIPHSPFAYSPFFLPRRQLLPEWRNPVVTWLSENTSCIFSRDFRIASPFPVSLSFAADVMLLSL